ncbi:uncharacterized protein [Littorina saxatilis]|uniref:uncharacterized protein n=1 Tax=Littorina saxatilis TaxID=31220 RepID=UPI0038B544E8
MQNQRKLCCNDDVYQKLWKCYGVSGRGNRPKPPSDLQLTNRLLLQLRKLKEDSGKTVSAEQAWFIALFPDVAFPADRVSKLINRIHGKLQKFMTEGADPTTFLEEKLDLDHVSESLSQLGLKRRQLLASGKKVNLPTDFHCTNQLVHDLETFKNTESSLKCHPTFTVEWVTLLSEGKEVRKEEISSVMNTFRNLNRHKNKDPEKPALFLSTTFSVATRTASSTCGSTPPASSTCGSTTTSTKRKSSTKCTSDTGDEKKLKTLLKDNAVLAECSYKQAHFIEELQDTIDDLSADRKKLLHVPNTISNLQAKIETLNRKG